MKNVVENKNSSSQLFYENEISDKNNKSEFLTLNNSLDKNVQNTNNNTLNKRKNLQNLEISKINTTKTVNQTNIMEDDFVFDDYLKTDTIKVKSKHEGDAINTNNANNFQTTIKSKKKETILQKKNCQNNKSQDDENSLDNKEIMNKSNKLRKNESLEKSNKIILNKKSNSKYVSKGSNFEVINSCQLNKNPKQIDIKSKTKLQINTSNNVVNTAITPYTVTKNKAIKNERKPVVNIKIDLRDIVREDIIDSYIQNTNSIVNNSNIKSSLSPVTKHSNKTPFMPKKTAASTASKSKDFISYVENCSNPNKKAFHLDNAKRKQNPRNFKKQQTVAILENSREKLKGRSEAHYNSKNPLMIKGPMNKSNENIQRQVQQKANVNKNNKIVCLDISDDGEIVDNTEKINNDFDFSPENKVKYKLKPKPKPVFTKEDKNDSFGAENSASFN